MKPITRLTIYIAIILWTQAGVTADGDLPVENLEFSFSSGAQLGVDTQFWGLTIPGLSTNFYWFAKSGFFAGTDVFISYMPYLSVDAYVGYCIHVGKITSLRFFAVLGVVSHAVTGEDLDRVYNGEETLLDAGGGFGISIRLSEKEHRAISLLIDLPVTYLGVPGQVSKLRLNPGLGIMVSY